MVATMEKVGGNRVITIPEIFFSDNGFAENRETVNVSFHDGKVLIDETGNKLKTVEERLIEFYGEDYMKYSEPPEIIDWGPPVGREIW